MAILLQHRLDPPSRLVRLMLAEYGIPTTLEDVSPWRGDAKLSEVDPAATVPVLQVEHYPPMIGQSATVDLIEKHFAPDSGANLVPEDVLARAETFRMLDWVNIRFNDEVTRYVLEEKIGKRERKTGAPDPSALRAAKANLVEHLKYFAYLLATRRWLAGDELTLADFALAAHLSALDYLGDVPWPEHEEVKFWYARVKSRPAFRSLLADRVTGTPPSATYADLDF